MRTVKRHAERLRLDTAHFTHQRAWSDHQLREAVGGAGTWADVLRSLGLTDRPEARVRVKARAVRLELDVSHLRTQRSSRTPVADLCNLSPDLSMLRVAAEWIAIAWFTIRGAAVAIPAQPTEYDLLVTLASGTLRVQVKSTTSRRSGRWYVSIGRRPYTSEKATTKMPYDPDSVDYFMLINGEGAST